MKAFSNIEKDSLTGRPNDRKKQQSNSNSLFSVQLHRVHSSQLLHVLADHLEGGLFLFQIFALLLQLLSLLFDLFVHLFLAFNELARWERGESE